MSGIISKRLASFREKLDAGTRSEDRD
jgi:hypothetical protein